MPETPKDDKHAKAPAPLKQARNESEDDDAGGAGQPQARSRQKTLATALSRAIVISTMVAAIAFTASTVFSARYNRYALIQAPNTSNNFVYRLDRLTGSVQFCGQQQCVDVVHIEK